jgi:hypothetical protein
MLHERVVLQTVIYLYFVFLNLVNKRDVYINFIIKYVEYLLRLLRLNLFIFNLGIMIVNGANSLIVLMRRKAVIQSIMNLFTVIHYTRQLLPLSIQHLGKQLPPHT